MKKLIVICMSVAMLLMAAACGSSNTGDASTSEKPGAGYAGELTDMIAEIYEANPVDFMVGDPMVIDLADADAVNYYTGLSDASNVKEAYFSEAMIGSMAYSMVAVRANDAASAADIAQSMFDGINQSKWICVTADALAVGASGDTVLLVMVDSELAPDLHTGMLSTFADLCGGIDVSLDRISAE